MKMKNLITTSIALCLILFVNSIAWAAPLTAEQMYLDPSLVLEDYYDYDYYTAGHTAYFANVQSLKVLPLLTADGNAYYFTPTVDYTGDITDANGSITFIRPGPYFVLATYTDETTELFDYGIEFLMQDANDKKTHNWEEEETPAPDVVIVDSNPYEIKNPNAPPPTLTRSLKDSQPDFNDGTTEVNDPMTWEEVINYITKNLTNKHVELSGHGLKGKFFWDGNEVPITDFAKLKGHVNYLTFMSCLTGAGPEGDAFLSTIAIYLGKAGAYTDCVAGNGKEWSINDDGYFKIVQTPKAWEPCPNNISIDMHSDPILSWTPGAYADTHDVYFGTNFNDVNDANRSDQSGLMNYSLNQSSCSYYPGLLEFDTTYYWRVDEVNMADDPNTWKGDVWSFTTGKYHVVENFEEYADTTALKAVWKPKSDIKASREIECGLEHSGLQAMAIEYDNTLSQSEAYVDVNEIDNIVGKNWRLQDVKALSLWLHGIPDLIGSYTGSDPYTLEGDGSGIYNTNYDVFYYLYTEKAGQITGQVTARVDSIDNTDDLAMAGVMLRDTLDPGSIYAATVVTPCNEVMFIIRVAGGSTSAVLGTVSGITLPHWIRITRAVSMMMIAEHANDVGGVPDKWEQIGSSQFIPGIQPICLGLCVTSNNYGEMCTAGFSNVQMRCPITTVIPDPTTEKDIGNYVYNDPEAMYVVLQDSYGNDGIVYYENKDTTVTQTGDWTEWRIDLNDFIVQGVDMCDVNTMYIGIGDKDDPSSGSGTMYIDDIALYAAEFYEPECPPLPPDLARNGEVGYDDLKMITDNWLIGDYEVIPAEPPSAPVSWYRLEQDADDSANGFDANEYGIKTADYVAGMEGSWALDLKGDANYIEADYNAADYGIDGNKPRTITVWAYTRDFSDNIAGIYEIGGHEASGQEFSMLTKAEEPNVWRANHWGGPENWDIDFEYPSLNTWVHLAHVYDGTIVRVYANGCAIAEAERVLDLNTATAKNFSIGRWSYSEEPNYFDGIVDDVRIYDYALSQANAAYIARNGDTTPFTQPLELLLTPHDPGINLFAEDPNMINFRDAAEMGNHWGETQIWPTW